MASPSSQGRRRTPGKSTTEDQALNVIASEAEARLAAKRAARAEARIIRMKELERMQQEADEKMDREYQRSLITEDPIKQRAARVTEKLQSRPPPSNDNEMNGPVSQDTQLRNLQDNLREVSEKYKKAMVSNAQFDNEKQALAYQVDCLKDRLEEAEEVIENLKQEILDKTRDINRLSRENKNHIEELEKAREQLILRDKLLEEHGIPTDGSEQPDISQNELANRMNDSVNLDLTDFDTSATNKSRESSRRSSAPDDRDSLLEQIKVLKEQVSDLRRNPEYDEDRMRDFESLQTSDDQIEQISTTGVPELEKSEAFEDVTDEAIEIRDRLRSGMIVNNNERNEDYDVIEQNARQGELPNFEDRSFELSSGLTDSVTESAAGSMQESYRSHTISESYESEKPLEISTPVEIAALVNLDEAQSLTIPKVEGTAKTVTEESEKDLTDYDIVESATAASKGTIKSTGPPNESETLPVENKPVDSVQEQEDKNQDQLVANNVKEGLLASDNEAELKEGLSDIVDVSKDSQAVLIAQQSVIDRIMTGDDAAGSDIVEIELSDTAVPVSDEQDGNECFEELDDASVQPVSRATEEQAADTSTFDTYHSATANNQLESDLILETTRKMSEVAVEANNTELLTSGQDAVILVDDMKSDIVDISLTKDADHTVDEHAMQISTIEKKLSEEDEDEFDYIESDDIFVDAKSDLSDDSVVSDTKIEETGDISEARSPEDQVTIVSECDSSLDKSETVADENDGDDGDEFQDSSDQQYSCIEDRDRGPSRVEQDECGEKEEKVTVGDPENQECQSQIFEDISSQSESEANNISTVESKESVSDTNQTKEAASSENEVTAITDQLKIHEEASLITCDDVNLGENPIDSARQNTAKIEEKQKQSTDTMLSAVEVTSDSLEVVERNLDEKNEVGKDIDSKSLEEEAVKDNCAEYKITDTDSSADKPAEHKDNFETPPTCDQQEVQDRSSDSEPTGTQSAEDQKEEITGKSSDLKDDHPHESVPDEDKENNEPSSIVKDDCIEIASPLPSEESQNNQGSGMVETSGKDVTNSDSVPKLEEDDQANERPEADIKSPDIEVEEVVEIPDKDYPSEELQQTQSSSEGKVGDTVNEGGDAEETGQDQLITAFETRKRLGSLSPGSIRKQVSPEPVPKQRKKKKKKKEKGSVMKMFVQELASTSFDSGSGSEAADQPEKIEENQRKKEEKDPGEETTPIEDLQPQGDEQVDTEGNMLSAGANDSAQGNPSEDAGETSEEGIKGKSKDKSKSKKDSKKDGCKSQ
ncbi:FK506-binding protein 5-like [Rhopilema esculentum]|uniref:FK506-binding protein 5-like n=1 Tax=Rhopilema esculentum TaxID=499914 RepID=UPI0031E319F2